VSRPRPRDLPLSQAIALGLLHGPTELLPVSSSAHTTLVPWLLGWRYCELDPALRKSFEVSLHAGTAVGLLARPPWRSGEDAGEGRMRAGARAWSGVPPPRPRRLARIVTLAGATVPPAGAGFVLGEKIEQRLGTPSTIAAGLFAGAVAMAAAELRAQRSGDTRSEREVGPRDWLALGAAQALALIPGLSRSGLATAAARMRGFGRVEADRLCWQVGLPVIAGAASLKAVRQARAGIPAEDRRSLAAGAGAALFSTYLSAHLLPANMRIRLLPATIAYRAALAGAVTVRMRRHAWGTPDQSQ
jgi:undecaprenyl-diphosphatase